MVCLVGEHRAQAVLLFVGEQLDACAQHPADAVEGITGAAAVPTGLLLDALPGRTTTVVDHDDAYPADAVARAWDTGLLNHVWVGDITYLRTWQGWLYLATVIDAHSRRVIGWAIDEHMRADLVEQALQVAITLRGELPAKVIFHADRGTQYASAQIAEFAKVNGITRSMGRTGVCWDNAMAESFFATLKTEFYYRRVWPTHARAKLEVGAWIEDRYNRRRRHSALGQTSPVTFEMQHCNHPAADLQAA